MRSRLAQRGTLLALATCFASFCSSSPEPEDELKAAIVLSFVRYTDWNTVRAQDPITVGVAGRPEFARVLSAALEGKTAGNHRLAVVETPDGACANCQIVYIASQKSAEVRQLLAAAANTHALTMGETDRFLEWGGAINLLAIDGRMSFDVNLDTVGRTGNTISSKLLRFGQVRGAKGERAR